MLLFGGPNIEKMKAKGDTRGLQKVLYFDKDPELRAAAAAALGSLGHDWLSKDLLAVLRQDSSSTVQQTAARALGQIGGKQEVVPLIEILRSPDEGLRLAAEEALCALGKVAVPSLLTACASKHHPQTLHAVRALGRIGDAEAAATLAGLLGDGTVGGAAAHSLVQLGPSGVDRLVASLSHKAAPVRRSAAQGLKSAGWNPSRDQVGVRYCLELDNWDGLVEIGRPATKALSAVLREGSHKASERAAATLARIDGGESILLPLLHDPDPALRALAAEALVAAGWEPGHDADGVAFCLERGDWDGLVRIGEPAVEPLAGMVAGDDPARAEQAARCLGRIGAPAVEPLLGLLKADKPAVRSLAAQALAAGGWEPGQDAAGVAFCLERGDWDRLVCIGEPAVEPLAGMVAGDDPARAEQAARCLGRIGAPAVEPLLGLLKADKPAVRALVAEALVAAGWQPGQDAAGVAFCLERGDWDGLVRIGEPAVDSLIAFLLGSDADLRDQAALALERIARPAHERLVRVLAQQPGPAALAAAKVLAATGWQPGKDAQGVTFYVALGDWQGAARLGEVAIGPLLRALGDKTSPTASATASAALVSIGLPAVPSLLATVTDPRSPIRQVAARTLEKMGWQPTNDAQGAAYWAIMGEWEKCAELGPVAVGPLAEALCSAACRGREGAAFALAWIGTDEALQALASAVRSENSAIRAAAAQALVQIGDACAVRVLQDILKGQPSPGQSTALTALAGIKSPAALDVLAGLLRSDDWAVRLDACRALVSVGDSRGLQSLISALNHGSYLARGDASQELAGLYRSKGLSPDWKRKILEQKDHLVGSHTDKHNAHTDYGSRTAISDCTHEDGYGHYDSFERLWL